MKGIQPVDRNCTSAAKWAVPAPLPAHVSDEAKAAWLYFEGTTDYATIAAFWYKGKLVFTDESGELTESGDGSAENPYGCPRSVMDDWSDGEAWLEEVYERLEEDEVEGLPKIIGTARFLVGDAEVIL